MYITNHITYLTIDAEGIQNILCYPKVIKKVMLEIPYWTVGIAREVEVDFDSIIVIQADSFVPTLRQDDLIIEWLEQEYSNFRELLTEHCVNRENPQPDYSGDSI